jgi:MYXO-CTERM domain-containing protein
VFKSYLLSLPIALLAMASFLHADTTATDATPGLFDGSSGTRTVTFTGFEPGFGTGTILDLNISINFAKADGESFDPPFSDLTAFFDEIHFHLTGPDGTVVHLIESLSWDIGTGLGAFDGTITFDDEAALVVNFGPGPFAGSFLPTGPGALSDFDGLSALGTWTLFIQDDFALDALRFRSFTLDIATERLVEVPTDPTDGNGRIPEPAGLGLFGLAVLGIVRRFRRRRAA